MEKDIQVSGPMAMRHRSADELIALGEVLYSVKVSVRLRTGSELFEMPEPRVHGQ